MAALDAAQSDTANRLAMALVASSEGALLLLDDHLAVVAASRSFCRQFDIDGAAIRGRPILGVGDGEWNTPQLGAMLEAAAHGRPEIGPREMDLVHAGHETRRLVLSAKPLDYVGRRNARLLLEISDVTDARRADALREDLLREKVILLKELHHRVANSLQIIAGVLMQSARRVNSEETRSHLYDAHRRVMSIAAVQKQLAVSSVRAVALRAFFDDLCDSLSAAMIGDRRRIALQVITDDKVVGAETSVSLGLIVTELVINALKHAFPDDRRGKIIIEYRSDGTDWTLSVTDDGVGMKPDPGGVEGGLGTSIVSALARQLGAEVVIGAPGRGAAISIVHAQAAPAAEARQAY